MGWFTSFFEAHRRAVLSATLLALISIPVNARTASVVAALLGAMTVFAFWLVIFMTVGALLAAIRDPRPTSNRRELLPYTRVQVGGPAGPHVPAGIAAQAATGTTIGAESYTDGVNYCWSCGASLHQPASFCSSCGSAI